MNMRFCWFFCLFVCPFLLLFYGSFTSHNQKYGSMCSAYNPGNCLHLNLKSLVWNNKGHKFMPPPALKKCYFHANISCIQYQTIKACLQNENYLPCSTYSGISVINSRFTACSLFQENKTVVISAKSIRAYQIFAVSIVDKGMSQRWIAGVQSKPWSSLLARAVSDVDCKCYSWKWELFGHWHYRSNSLRARVLVNSLVYCLALQGDVVIKHCL